MSLLNVKDKDKNLREEKGQREKMWKKKSDGKEEN